MFYDLAPILAVIIAFLASISVHECAHALVANWLGDPTAKVEGRLSLNPLKHLDPFGTVLLLLVHFGWGKPVPVNPRNLKSPLRDQALISLAGPAANLLFAMLLVVPVRYFLTLNYTLWGGFISLVLSYTLSLNVVLMVFNLLPIPPLDGSKLLFLVLGRRFGYISEWLEYNGPMVLFAFLVISNYIGFSIISRIADVIITALFLGN